MQRGMRKPRGECERESTDGVVPRMRHHAGAQVALCARKHAKERAIHGDEQHARQPFVSVRKAKDQRGAEQACPRTARHDAELLLQIAAEDELLHDACGDAHRDPEC